MAVITDVDLKNNVAEYLQAVENGEEFVVTKNGKQIGKFFPADDIEFVKKSPRKNFDEIMHSLTGILKGDEDYKSAKDEYLREKYDITD